MRWVFILFLVSNVVYFGWELDRQSKLDRQNISPAASSSSGAQSLKLISESETRPRIYQSRQEQGPESNGISEVESVFAFPDNNLVTDLPAITTLNLDTDSSRQFCYTFGPIEEELLAVGVGDWFKSRRATTHIRYSDEQGKQLFWIYLAPRDSGGEAIDIIRDLKDNGIEDYRIISKGKLQNAISLGLYSGQSQVNSRIGELKEKGYKPIVVPYINGKRVYWVDVQLSVDPGSLDTVFQGYPARYNYVPVDCDRIAMLTTNP